MQHTLKNHDKELATIKGQLNKIQHVNQNLPNKLKEAKHVVKKTENLHKKYVEFNKLNWKIHNDLKHFQTDFEGMTRDYKKIEEFSMQQQNTITALEQTYQEFKELT
jgi:uncharacterized coiled-coil DUF342 family protein